MENNLIPFPFSRMGADAVARCIAAATKPPGEVITSAAFGDTIRLEVGGAELWFSVDEFAELIEQWSETLADAAEAGK